VDYLVSGFWDKDVAEQFFYTAEKSEGTFLGIVMFVKQKSSPKDHGINIKSCSRIQIYEIVLL